MSKSGYIAIEGPIGVGKTSLAKLFCEEFDAKGVFEDIGSNPFIKDFYQDRKKHAFQTQLFFLINRYQQQKDLHQQELFKKSLVSDYIFAKDKVFAYLNLDNNELMLYEQIYSLLDARLAKPDLVVYLQAEADVLIQRIKKRGLDFEKNLEEEYLTDLIQSYNRFFFHYSETPLLVVNTSKIDFVQNNEDYKSLIKEVSEMGKGIKYFVPRLSR